MNCSKFVQSWGSFTLSFFPQIFPRTFGREPLLATAQAPLSIIFAVTLFWSPETVSAEFVCKSELGYRWKKAQEEKELEVAGATLEGRGPDEVTAKRALTTILERERVRVLGECKEEHENLAACFSGKFRAMEGSLQRMGFSQRKAIEEAITADCAARQGYCIKPVTSEIKCEEIVTGGSSSSAESGKDSKDKGKKKREGKEEVTLFLS